MILGILGRAQRRRILSVNLRMLKTEWMLLAGHHGVGGSEMASFTCPDFGLGCQPIALALFHMVTFSVWPLHNSLGSERTQVEAVSPLQAWTWADCLPVLLVPKVRRKEAETKAASGAPQTYFSLCLCWCWAGPHMPLSGNLEGQGAEEGQILLPGSQLSSVYVGCIVSTERHKLNLFHR